MGIAEDAKETAHAAVTKATRAVEDSVDRAKDNVAETRAEAKVKEAETERDSVQKRNAAKDTLRGN